MSDESRIELWADKGLTITDRLETTPAVKRDIDQSLLDQKLQRGDLLQRIRLRRYPSIEVDFDTLYAGSVQGDIDDAKQKLFEIGFRNGPLAYVEVTEKFGPDDGSLWLNIIRETGSFPNVPLNNFVGFRRIKDQIHISIFRDEKRDMVHVLAHREKSAALQPLRHLTISQGDAERGVRDFRDVWVDTFNNNVSTPLE